MDRVAAGEGEVGRSVLGAGCVRVWEVIGGFGVWGLGTMGRDQGVGIRV